MIKLRWEPLTVCLVLLNGGLVIAGVICLLKGTDATTILATRPKSLDLPVPPEMVPSQPGRWQALQQLAVFHATRRFHEASDPAQTVPPPNYRLTGVFLLPNKPPVAVLVQPSTGQSRKVVPGDDLEGWLVRGVEMHRVTVEHGAQRIELTDGKSGASPPGLQVRPINRVAGSPGGVRVLGQSGVATSSLPVNRPVVEPRLYRPPPP
jgi:hypothetical protein